jgi:hypothetical protein
MDKREQQQQPETSPPKRSGDKEEEEEEPRDTLSYLLHPRVWEPLHPVLQMMRDFRKKK